MSDRNPQPQPLKRLIAGHPVGAIARYPVKHRHTIEFVMLLDEGYCKCVDGEDWLCPHCWLLELQTRIEFPSAPKGKK